MLCPSSSSSSSSSLLPGLLTGSCGPLVLTSEEVTSEEGAVDVAVSEGLKGLAGGMQMHVQLLAHRHS
jgi:hypothetical protein